MIRMDMVSLGTNMANGFDVMDNDNVEVPLACAGSKTGH